MNQSLLITKNGLLLLLFALLLTFFKGPNLLYGGLAFSSIATYHLLTDRRYSIEQILNAGLMTVHLGIYLLLCTLLIWATTGEEESHYWIIYFLPIVGAAANLSLLRTLFACFFSSLFYLALIPVEIWTSPHELREDLPEFLISCTTFFIVGVVVHGFSEQNRQQLVKQKKLNELLIQNRNALQESFRKLEATEESLRRKDRLAALGEMSAGLAHEIRNPLGVISSSAQLLQSQLATQSDSQVQLLEVIREESVRLNNLVSDFLKFGRPSKPDRNCCDLTQLVQRTVAHLKPIAQDNNVQFDLDPPPQQLHVNADAAMIQQLLLNLLLNAIEACSDGGNVLIQLHTIDQQAKIAITDNGCGIDTKALPSIFNPFVTTKDCGTGLGLATAHSIAESHGGTIEVTSKVGQGSCFAVHLPLGDV